jgi:hypothetical protein
LFFTKKFVCHLFRMDAIELQLKLGFVQRELEVLLWSCLTYSSCFLPYLRPFPTIRVHFADFATKLVQEKTALLDTLRATLLKTIEDNSDVAEHNTTLKKVTSAVFIGRDCPELGCHGESCRWTQVQGLLMARVAEAQAEAEDYLKQKSEIAAENTRLHGVVDSLRASLVGPCPVWFSGDCIRFQRADSAAPWFVQDHVSDQLRAMQQRCDSGKDIDVSLSVVAVDVPVEPPRFVLALWERFRSSVMPYACFPSGVRLVMVEFCRHRRGEVWT